MKFTSEELAKTIGIKIGDKIRNSKGEVADVIEDYILDFHPWRIGLHILIDEDFEILQPKKKVGEKLCREMVCYDCPLSGCCRNVPNKSLLTNLKFWNDKYNDKEIYDILKARLDKEVKDE